MLREYIIKKKRLQIIKIRIIKFLIKEHVVYCKKLFLLIDYMKSNNDFTL